MILELKAPSAAARKEARDKAGYVQHETAGRRDQRCKNCSRVIEMTQYGRVTQWDRLCARFKCRVKAIGCCDLHERCTR